MFLGSMLHALHTQYTQIEVRNCLYSIRQVWSTFFEQPGPFPAG